MDKSVDILLGETFNMALLDSGCTKTVCGEAWLELYINSLPDREKKNVVENKSSNMFKFGDNKVIKSNRIVTFPVCIANVNATITTDVIDYEIPLLLSKEAMKKAKTKIDFSQDKVHIFGQSVDVNVTTSGHYCLALNSKYDNISQQQASITLFCKNIDNKSNEEKIKIASKLHRQFAHPPSERLLQLISDSGIIDKQLADHIKKLDTECEICNKYKKAKPRPIVGFPLSKVFNETLAIDLKEWSYSPKIWLLHIIDHSSRFSVSCVIKSKRKEVIVTKIFQHWITTFGYPNRILVDNGGEFANDEFMTFCENLNIRICTTAAESPWSNGLIERHNAVLGSTVSKTIEESNCDLELAVAWAISAKNALKNVHGFSPNQLVFGKNPNYPCAENNQAPALENKTSSQVVAANLNALHSARKRYVELESSEKIQRALRKNIRNYSDQVYQSGDVVFYKRSKTKTWKGPGTVIGFDGQQIVIKHGSFVVRVHSCNVRLKNEYTEGNDLTSGQNKKSENAISHNEKEDISDTEEDICLDESISGEQTNHRSLQRLQNSNNSETQSEIPENVQINSNQSLVSNNDGHPESLDNYQNDDINDHATLSNEDTINNVPTNETFDNKVVPKKGQYIECKTKDNQTRHIEVLSRAGKATGKYSNWYNIRDLDDTSLSSIDWNNVEEWKLKQTESVLISDLHIDKTKLALSRVEELNKWKENDVYETVELRNQKFITTRWVNTEKFVNGRSNIKSRLVARGFQEENSDLPTDSPTCTKEGLRLVLSVIASNNWVCSALDVKCAFLQGRPIERDVYIKPPKEAGLPPNKLWKLNKNLYGLSDASRSWYVSVK